MLPLTQQQLQLYQQSNYPPSSDDQTDHLLLWQLSAQAVMQHEQLQRQSLLERERLMHLAAASQHMPHAQAFQLQEEYLR